MNETRFLRSERLLRRQDFTRLASTDSRIFSRCFVILSLPAERGHSRIGITVSRKVGNAVCRNRIKRLIREYFRTHKQFFAGKDVSIIARKGAAELALNEVCRELDRALVGLTGMRC